MTLGQAKMSLILHQKHQPQQEKNNNIPNVMKRPILSKDIAKISHRNGEKIFPRHLSRKGLYPE